MIRLFACVALLTVCAGCKGSGVATAPPNDNPVLREARDHFTYQGKPILPYFLNDFAGGPGAPDAMTVGWGTRICAVAIDGLRPQDQEGAYASQETRHHNSFYGFDYREYPFHPSNATVPEFSGYRFLGTSPGGVTALEYLTFGSGSMVINGVLLVRFDIEQTGVTLNEQREHLVMRFLQELNWGDRVARDVRLEGNKLLLGPTRVFLPHQDEFVKPAETILLDGAGNTMAGASRPPASAPASAPLATAASPSVDSARATGVNEGADSVNPIDRMVAEAEKKYPGSMTLAGTYRRATVLWDTEMNRQYGPLMNRLPKSLQDQLRTTQRAWIIFRDEQMRYLQMYYQHEHGNDDAMGTLFLASRAWENMLITKRRTEDLTYTKVDNTFIP